MSVSCSAISVSGGGALFSFWLWGSGGTTRTEGDDWSGTGSDTPFVSRFSGLHLARNCLTGCFAEAAFEDMYLFFGVVFCCFSFWLKGSGKMERDDWPRETGFDLRRATGSYAAAAALLLAP